MIRKRARKWLEWGKNVVTQPREELNRGQAATRFMYELGVHGYHALVRDNAPQMAAALSFRTLFALLPVVIVSAALVNAMQGPEQFKQMVDWLIQAAGLDDVVIGAPEAVVGEGEVQRGEPLGVWLQKQVHIIANLRLATLGWMGMAVLIYSAISLMVTIENGFNTIYGAPEGRSWTKRFLVYWFVLTLGPVFIGLTVYIDSQVSGLLEVAGTWAWLLEILRWSWSFLFGWLFMIAVYRLVPNTQVTMRAAIFGAFVAALALQIGRSLLAAYFGKAVMLGNIYGTLGLVPVFMFWLYLMWLMVLFGLEVSATIQRVTGLHLQELQDLKSKQQQNGIIDPAAVVTVMEVVSERFLQGKPTSAREIADEVVMSEAMVSSITDRLVREGYLHRVDSGDGALALARVPDQISAEHLISIGYDLVDQGQSGRQSALVQRLREVQMKIASQATMATLVQSQPKNEASPG